MQELIDYALPEDSTTVNLQKAICMLGTVSTSVSQRIAENTGLITEGYRFSLDNMEIRHIMKRHGKTDKEQLHGQAAIEKADLMRLAECLQKPNQIRLGLLRRKDIKLLEFVVADALWYYTIIL